MKGSAVAHICETQRVPLVTTKAAQAKRRVLVRNGCDACDSRFSDSDWRWRNLGPSVVDSSLRLWNIQHARFRLHELHQYVFLSTGALSAQPSSTQV